MLEADKVSHILEGIADDAFNLLVYKGCSTVDDIIRECRRFEEAKSRRVSQQFVRLHNTAASSSCEDVQPPGAENVLRLVRREIEAASPSVPPARSYDESRPAVSLIQAVVREELANAGIRPTCSVSSPTVGNFFRPPRPQSTPTSDTATQTSGAHMTTSQYALIAMECVIFSAIVAIVGFRLLVPRTLTARKTAGPRLFMLAMTCRTVMLLLRLHATTAAHRPHRTGVLAHRLPVAHRRHTLAVPLRKTDRCSSRR